ncbi:MOP flippase family protein [Vibrio alginolyticus]|uniref:MOP flippase family protein n=1 Tax=Vibrio alginolyticus TaxID=663 RepID=UPI00211A17FC|nr:MOP flippase family protein [Vibrio alginolyticus]MCQ9070333.1 MOP flippase family protein [Vibrio alginolyticus]
MNIKDKAIRGVKWTSLSSITVAVCQIVQLAILARYIDPQGLGLIAISTVVIGFCNLFMDMGISNAVIHKREVTKEQFSCLFTLNIIFGVFLTLLVYFSSNIISLFFNEPALSNILGILAITFFISSVGNLHRAILQKELRFNTLAKIEIFSTVSSLILTIVLVLLNYDIYSIVYGAILKVLLQNFIIFFKERALFKPEIKFSFYEVRDFLSFGMFQLGERSINYFSSQFDTIIIGKLLGAEVLGVYSVVKQLCQKPFQILNPVINRVSFPVLAKFQDDKRQLSDIFIKVIRLVTISIIPFYSILALSSYEILEIYLGPGWGEHKSLLIGLCVVNALNVFGNPVGSLQLAKGRADLGFYINLLMSLILLPSLYISAHYSLILLVITIIFIKLISILPIWRFVILPLSGIRFSKYISPLISTFLVNVSLVLFLYSSFEDMNIEIYLLVIVKSVLLLLLLLMSYVSLYPDVRSKLINRGK